MTTKHYRVHDRFEHIASNLRRKSTWANPRYYIVDENNVPVDEATTKRVADGIARDMNAKKVRA